MTPFDPVDWQKLFTFQTPILEIFVRGTAVYLLLFVTLRVILKRQTGSVGITDLLVVILLADAVQNAMVGEAASIPEGLVLVATIVLWSYLFDWMAFKFPFVQRLLTAPPLPLVADGKMLHQNMRKELITREELMVQLREQGIDDLAKVKSANMENDGQISAILKPEFESSGDTPRAPAKSPVV